MKIQGTHSSRSSGRPSVAAVCCVVAVTVLATAIAIAQDSPDVTHFIDLNTDRSPAVTAFPKYPSIARRDRIEGETTVCFKIKANGQISRPVVTESSHRIFARPALLAMKKSSFEPVGPGQIVGTARSCRIYRFRLDPILVRVDSDDQE